MGHREHRERAERRGQDAPLVWDHQGEVREPRPPRTPLVWETERIFRRGRVVLVLQRAQLERGGVRRSFRLGKESEQQPDKPFPFLGLQDVTAVVELLGELGVYCASLAGVDGLDR